MRWLVLAGVFAVGLGRLAMIGSWNELWLTGGVLALLGLFFIVAFALRRRKDGQEIAVRTETWCWMIGVFILARSLHPILMSVFLACLSFVALREYFSLLPMYHRGTFLRAEDRLAMALAYLTIPVTYALAYDRWYGLYVVLIPVYAALTLPILLVAADNPRGFVVSMGAIYSGMFLFVFLFSHAALLAGLSPFLLFYALLVTELRDVLAYCFGRLLGRTALRCLHAPIAPKINPRKTWAGSTLAALGCAGASVAIGPLMPELPGGRPTSGFLLALGFAVGWLGLAGDLATGAIKRDFRVKDTSRALPGHGGIIDRINGAVFTVPVIFHIIYFAYYPGRLRL